MFSMLSRMAMSLRMFGIDYGREQQPKISQPRRIRRDGGLANRCVRDGGFGAAVDCEGVRVEATRRRGVGNQASQVEKVHRSASGENRDGLEREHTQRRTWSLR